MVLNLYFIPICIALLATYFIKHTMDSLVKAASSSKISLPTLSDHVYKDDCMFSFDTPFDEGGIDICMTCFQALSRGKYNYTKRHSRLFKHDLFLNYRKTPKAIKPDEQPQKMLKLEIKEKTEDELFDLETAIYDASTNSSYDYPNNNLPTMIQLVADGILKATSSDKQQQIKAWRQEVKVCPHSKNISQSKNNGSLTACTDCGLEENLWLCLECGHIGCGRKQFGGVPGNSHAVSHNKEFPDHHVAVKLGSLSLNSADCYCYTCDDDVKVPNLSSLLKFYGIDIAHHEKTEKNLTELQIEQNVKWDFKMDGSNGEALNPVFGKGLTGFKNLGNSCYLASVLQVLFSIPEFAKAYYDSTDGVPESLLSRSSDPADDLEIQMYKLGDGLLSGRYSVPDKFTTEVVKYQRGIRPSGFKHLVGKGDPQFSTMQQQDAFEFWSYLVDQLEKADVRGLLDYSPVDVFKFVLETKIRCTKCGGVRLKKELDESMCLPVEEVDTRNRKLGRSDKVLLEQCFDEWRKGSQFEYQCPACKSKQMATSTQGFKTFPKYLVVNPQRIKLVNWVPVKLSVAIKFGEHLSLSQYRSDGKLDDERELPDDDKDKDESGEITFNPDFLTALMGMGFTENRCKKALYNTANTSAEAAANWLFEHMDDPHIDDPFHLETSASAKQPSVSQQDIDSITSMGFAAQLAKKALILNDSNVEQAVNWIFANPDDDGKLPEPAQPRKTSEQQLEDLLVQPDMGGEYSLMGVICHKGTSIHSGHYVAFIKKHVDGHAAWVLFNDEKVVAVDESVLSEVEVSGYIYLYEKVAS